MFDQNRINLDDLSHFFSSSARNEGTLIQLPNIKSSLQLRAVSGTQSGVERGEIEKRKDNILWDYITRKKVAKLEDAIAISKSETITH